MNNTTSTTPRPGDFTGLYVIVGLLALEMVIIIFANLLVYVLFAKHKKLRRKTNYCLISLATSDLLAGVAIIPLLISINLEQTKPNPKLGSSSFVAMDVSQRFVAISTILHIVLATGERCFKIHFPLRYQVCVTWKRIALALVAVWVVSLGTSLVKLALVKSSSIYLYSLICMVVLGWVPFLIILLVNIHTIWTIDRGTTVRKTSAKNAERNKRRKQKQRRAIVVYLIMTISFAFGCLSYFTIPVVVTTIPQSVMEMLLLLKFCTSFVNPLLYTFFKTDFKTAFNATLRKEERHNSRATQHELLPHRT